MRDLTKYRLDTAAERLEVAAGLYQHAVEFVEAVKKYLEEAI